MGGHLLPDLTSIEADDVEVFLRDLGKVFVVHRGHDSNNTSAGVEIDGRRWFVKWATDPEAVSHLESAVRLHTLVSHPAIAALRGWFTFPSGLALVHDWVVMRGYARREVDDLFRQKRASLRCPSPRLARSVRVR